MFSTRYMYCYHISILRIETYICTIVNTVYTIVFYGIRISLYNMPCGFTMYVVAVVLLSKCLGYFGRDGK